MLTAKDGGEGAEFSNSIAIKTDRLPHSAGPFLFLRKAKRRSIQRLGHAALCIFADESYAADAWWLW